MLSVTSKAYRIMPVTDDRTAKWQELKQFAKLCEFRLLFAGAQQADKVRDVAQRVLLGLSPQCTAAIHPSPSGRGSGLPSVYSAQPLTIFPFENHPRRAESQSTCDRRLGPSSEAKGTPSFHRQQRQPWGSPVNGHKTL